MSHFLKKVRIRNYRSIVDVEVQLASFSALVGENNAGKSNILNAIQWFVKPEKLEKSHFNSVGQSVEVAGEITGISTALLDALADNHATRLRPFVADEVVILKRSMNAPGAASTAKLEIWNPVSGSFEVNPTGISAAISILFPEPVRVEAMVDVPEDAAKNKTTTTLGKLLAQLASPVEAGQGDVLNGLFEQVGSLLSADGQDRVQELKDFDREASEAVQDYFPGIHVSVHFPQPSLADLFKSGTLRVKQYEGGDARDFAELGHGAQRSIQMAMVQLLASRARAVGNAPRCTLLLIDEPELYLHPQAIEQVRLSLKKLSKAGYQIVFSTHSPLLVAREDLPEASIVTQLDMSVGTKVNMRVSESVRNAFEGDKESQAQMLFELGNATEILFCRKVLLVEGHTDARVLPFLYLAVRQRSLRSDRIGIVRLSSSGDTAKALEVLSAMGISARALVDLDYAFKQAVSSRLIPKTNVHIASTKKWFSVNKDTYSIALCVEGLPTKGSDGGAEGAYRKMSNDPGNHELIQALHDELKEKSIWLWRKGSIEQVIGIGKKNNLPAITAKCLELEMVGKTALAEAEECSAFCEWLTSDIAEPPHP